MFVEEASDCSLSDHWTKDTAHVLASGDRVYTRVRVTTPPPLLQERYHRIKPVDLAHHRLKKQVTDQRRFDPAKFQKAMDLQKAKRNSSSAEVKSAGELKDLLRETCQVRLVDFRTATSASIPPASTIQPGQSITEGTEETETTQVETHTEPTNNQVSNEIVAPAHQS